MKKDFPSFCSDLRIHHWHGHHDGHCADRVMKKIFMFFALGFACSPPRWLSYTRRKASVDRTHFKFPEHLGGTPSSLFSSRLLRSRLSLWA
jgi:hypothetical protein